MSKNFKEENHISDESLVAICQSSRKLGAFHFDLAGTIHHMLFQLIPSAAFLSAPIRKYSDILVVILLIPRSR